jgi:hypothetical protein
VRERRGGEEGEEGRGRRRGGEGKKERRRSGCETHRGFRASSCGREEKIKMRPFGPVRS